MKAKVLVDNIASGNLKGEWGLSIFIQYQGKNILLDVGASGLFLENARKEEMEISEVDYAILSHAHYDHSLGMKDFFTENSKAKFFLRDGTEENCYFKKWFIHKYIGIPHDILNDYHDRFHYVSGDYELTDGVKLIPHKTNGLSEIGKKNNMYVRKNRKWIPDDFAHEQSLVFDTEDGLVIFNSCSHGGADNIIREISTTYGGKKVKALIGGFHIFSKTEKEVRELAMRIKETGVEAIYTGHCTGEKPFHILKEELGDMVQQLKVGLVMEF